MRLPLCFHPELFPATWDESKPGPARMSGCCERNCTCPVCGFGWGESPHFCDGIRRDYDWDSILTHIQL